tara:strand:+ start:1467 stop:2765 length:1299 start_codon:yes stop_codon:yes gene_type:complete
MAALLGHGARVSSDIQDAEVIIVNTCGFIRSAKEQSIETILDACAMKGEGDVRAVVAVGCLVQRHGDELAKEIPEVDLFLGLTELPRLVTELRGLGFLPDKSTAVPLMERPLRLLSSESRHTSYLKVSEGCDHTCAFCAIPMMRGLHRSQPMHDLVREASGLHAAGVQEINIISQDTTWYGRDLRRHDSEAPLLPDLLRALLEGTAVPWYRLFYMYPSGITRELVDLLASEDRILPYLDMPIQHGSDRILNLMRRPERRKTIIERTGWLREAIPGLTLRTTVIVGFPGESEDDFSQMLELLEEIQFERVGAFTYSVEEGTRAERLPGHVPQDVMDDRLEELMELQRAISFERNSMYVGRETDVLVDQPLNDDPEYGAVGRTAGQALDVDGVTHLIGSGVWNPGEFVRARVVGAHDYDLVAEIVETTDQSRSP